MKKRFSWFGLVAAIVIAAVFSSVITASFVSVDQRNKYNEKLQNVLGSDFTQKLASIEKVVGENFIKDFDIEQARDNAIAEYLATLDDRFTFYMNKEEMADYLYDSSGTLVGIGIHVVKEKDTGCIYVTRAMPASPAETAGIKGGDIIVAVDGVRITDENYSECVDMIRGESGTEVNLTISRDGKESDLSVTRGQVENETVYYEMLEGDIAHVTITEFITGTAKQFIACMNSIAEKGCKSYIFDVRNNPGGNLGEIIDVLDFLLPEGVLINIVYGNGTTKTYTSQASCVESPMVVLCNGRTASAGELFTAALRDFEVATIVGDTTFGKGTMQTIIPLGDGTGMRISIAYYNPPCNVSYDGIGITPDIEISLDDDVMQHFYQMTYEEDVQLQKAVEILKK